MSPSSDDRIALREFLSDRFNEDDLRILIFDLKIDDSKIDHKTRATIVLSLIQECERVERVYDLLLGIQKHRPEVPLPDNLIAWMSSNKPEAENTSTQLPESALPHDPLPLSRCPSTPGGVIDDPEKFVGRVNQLKEMRRLVTQQIPIHLSGPTRIGKTSLLKQFVLTSPTAFDSNSILPVYVTLQSLDTLAIQAFYHLLAQQFLEQHNHRLSADLKQVCKSTQNTKNALEKFREVLHKAKYHQWLPVFCVDEFDTVMHPQCQSIFDNTFYKNLRSLTQSKNAVFIFATRLALLGKDNSETSKFMNDGHKIGLGEFSKDEVNELVTLPRGGPTALPLAEQHLARQWGGTHPYLLQMACYQLWSARADGRDHHSAYVQFCEQEHNLTLGTNTSIVTHPSSLWQRIRLLFKRA